MPCILRGHASGHNLRGHGERQSARPPPLRCRFWAAYLNPVQWSIYGLITTQLGGFGNEFITGAS